MRLFIISMHDPAHAPASDRLHAKAFSITATVKILSFKRVYVKKIHINFWNFPD